MMRRLFFMVIGVCIPAFLAGYFNNVWVIGLCVGSANFLGWIEGRGE